MKIRSQSVFLAAVFFLAASLLNPGAGSAQEKQDMGGWEATGEYNKLYNAAELDRIKVTIVNVTEIVPLPGMQKGIGLIVREDDSDEDIMVHVCPSWFIKPGETGLKKGDVAKIRGSWTEIDGKEVFMASKIKKGDFFTLKVRLTKDGTPFWTMNPEQLTAERASD